MIKPLPSIAVFDYTLERERKANEQQPTVFALRALTPIQMMEVSELQLTVGITAARKRTLAYGLRGWTNFRDEGDKEVPFERSLDDNLAHLSVEIVIELATEIIARSKVTEADRKN